jgi:BirA family biotin operon repressor/biotin-[acetyl-CoA-carboxylase] ligase
VEHVTLTGSTNADVLARACAGEPAGLVLVADHQTAGRGRLDRRWEAPPGANLLVSILFRPAGPPDRWHRCLHAVAVAACDACTSFGVFTRIKWPNDLVVGGEKLAGILAEADGAGAVVVGLGCNLAWPLQGELEGATSLVAAGAPTSLTRVALVAAILDRVDEDAPDLLDRYRARCATIGRDVRVYLPDGSTVEGRAVDVDGDGRIVVATAGDTAGNTAGETAGNGSRRAFNVGDVVHLR